MKRIIASLFPLLCASLSLIFACNSAEAKAVKTISFDSDAMSMPIQPLQDLVNLVKNYPQVQRFRGTWGMAAPHASQGAELVYDRKHQVLWFQTSSSSWGEIEPDFDTHREQETRFQRMKFFGVTPLRLEKVLKKYRPLWDNEHIDGVTFYFPHLVEFGCKRRILLDRKKYWREKWIDNGKGGYWVKIR